MHLYKRGNVWWCEWIARGVKYRKSTRTGNRRVAEEWMRAIKTAAKMPTFEDAVEVLRKIYAKEDEGAKIPIESAWETYERIANAVGRMTSATTRHGRLTRFGAFARWLREEVGTVRYAEDVTGAIAARYAEYIAAAGKKSKTRANIIGDLSAIWALLAKQSARLANPWDGLKPAITDSVRYAPFSVEDERRVMEAAAKVGNDWPCLCVIARHTGLRYEDLALLRWSEVDLNAKVLRIVPKKTMRHRIVVTIPMMDEVANALLDRVMDGEFVFPLHARYYGGKAPKSWRRFSFSEVLRVAGLKGKGNYTFHSFRPTCASRLSEAGADIETRKRILGHTTDEMARHYDHAEHLDEMRAALEAAKNGEGK